MAKNFPTVLLCVNNPINFLLKNITLYNFFIIYSRKELANETFCLEGKFIYKMCAKSLLHTSLYSMCHAPSACRIIFHWWQNFKIAKFRLPLTFLHKALKWKRSEVFFTVMSVWIDDSYVILHYIIPESLVESKWMERWPRLLKVKMSKELSLL